MTPSPQTLKRPRKSSTPKAQKKKTIFIDSDKESDSGWKTDKDSGPHSISKPSQPNAQKKSGSKTSWVWHYFTEETINNKDVLVCHAKVKPGSDDQCLSQITPDKTASTKSMSRHLEQKHGITSQSVTQESAIDMDKYVKEGRVVEVRFFIFLSCETLSC